MGATAAVAVPQRRGSPRAVGGEEAPRVALTDAHDLAGLRDPQIACDHAVAYASTSAGSSTTSTGSGASSGLFDIDCVYLHHVLDDWFALSAPLRPGVFAAFRLELLLLRAGR